MTKFSKILLFMSAGVILSAPISSFAEEKEEAVQPTKAQQRDYDRRKADMKVLDVNKDGILQAQELQKAVTQKFENSDLNKDGVVSPAEQEATVGAFKNKGTKEYSTNTQRRAKRLENRYDDADANKDGTVSQEEYKIYFGQRYKSYDRNGDGIIDETEYRTDVEKLPRSYFDEDHNQPKK